MGPFGTVQITKTFSWLVQSLTEIETIMVSVERIKEFQDKPEEAAWKIPSVSLNRNWPNRGEIQFHNYQLRYRQNLDLVLKDLTFTIYAGERVRSWRKRSAKVKGPREISFMLFIGWRYRTNRCGEVILGDGFV